MRAPESIVVARIVATPDALDRAAWPRDAIVCRTAPDEVLLLDYDAAAVRSAVADRHAIVRTDTGWVGVTVAPEEARTWLSRNADWPLPESSPVFLQGLAAGLPVKVWWAAGAVRIFIPAPCAADFAERLS